MNPRPIGQSTAATRESIARYLLRRADSARPVVEEFPLPDYQRTPPPDEGERVYGRVRR